VKRDTRKGDAKERSTVWTAASSLCIQSGTNAACGRGATLEKHLTGTWEEFEAWIRETIGADYHWRVRPQHNATSREMVASLVLHGIKRSDGVFPHSNAFIARIPEHNR
jgi:hypothetical protein